MQAKWPFFLQLEPSYLQACSARTCRPQPAWVSCLWLYGRKPNSTSTPIFPQNKMIFSNSMGGKKKKLKLLKVVELFLVFRFTEEGAVSGMGISCITPSWGLLGLKMGRIWSMPCVLLKVWEIEKKLWLSDSLLSTVSQNMFSC